MKKDYVLSISIPTFGYPKAVEKNVTHLLKIRRKDIQIVVVDNDKTGKQIGSFMSAIEDPRFEYICNEKNIGRSANIAKAVDVAAAEYVLLMSSEDILEISTLDSIINEIFQNRGCALIMGRVLTDLGNLYGYVGIRKVYRRGYEALKNIPLMGNLVPMVIKKSYLDFPKLYEQEETYMQTRLALKVAGKGDFIGLDDVLAKTIDDASYKRGKHPEVYDVLDWNSEGKKLWSIGGECYYSPQARAKQLMRDLDSIEEHQLRRSQLLHLVDKFTTQRIFSAVYYIVACLDFDVVENGGSAGFMRCEEALSTFKKIMDAYFLLREKTGFYYYRGILHDKIFNELLNIKKARCLMREILDEKKVYVVGNEKEKMSLLKILEMMNISVVSDKNNMLVLVPRAYDWILNERLMREGARGIRWMDWMSKYLLIVWCEQHQSKEYMGFYTDI